LVRLRLKIDKESLREQFPGVNMGVVHALHSDTFLKENCHLFSRPDEVRELSIYHHTKKHKGLSEVIRTADGLSSSERRSLSEEYEKEYRKAQGMPYGDIATPLFSVFTQVELTQSRRFEGDRYDLGPLDIWNCSAFPDPDMEKLQGAYRRLREQMEKDVLRPGTWRICRDLNFKDDVVSLYYILYKYVWCMASATFHHKERYYPDISLFDHSTTTAAIAACLYLLDGGKAVDEDEEFAVLKGDVSGTQNFVYGIAQPQSVKGVSKRLRGRSFHVIVIAEAAARYILRKTNLTIVNLLHCGGGEFQILLPNEKKAIQAVDEAIGEIERGLFQQFHGELGITFAKVSFSRKKLERATEDFGSVLDLLNDEMGRAKGEKHRRMIDDGIKKFTMPQEKELKKPTYCRACVVELLEDPRDRLNPPPEEEIICPMCRQHRNIGGFIPRANFIVFADVRLDKPEDSKSIMDVQIPEGWGSVWLVEDNKTLTEFLRKNASKKGKAEVYRINRTDNFILDLDMNGESLKVSYGFWFLANSAPVAKEEFPHADAKDPNDEKQRYEPGDVLDFSDIAELSIGDNRLGILRMDVDRTGLIFSVGLDRGEKDTDKSMSRIATMSRMLNLFFCGRLNAICESVSRDWWGKVPREAPDVFKKYEGKISKNIFYTVYAGGDDLFIVGPWSEIPHLAQRINREFREFTSENPNITISGGAFLCKPKFPINRFAQLTGDELARSKESGGNTMTIFRESVVWQDGDAKADLGKLISFGEDLYSAATAEHPDDRLARTFLNGLIRMRQQFVKDDIVDPNFIPALIYQISRNVSDRASIKVDGEEKKLWFYLKERLISSADSWSTFKKIRIPATYALLKLRERR
jgi:CRISPR-associated protein Csm1